MTPTLGQRHKGNDTSKIDKHSPSRGPSGFSPDALFLAKLDIKASTILAAESTSALDVDEVGDEVEAPEASPPNSLVDTAKLSPPLLPLSCFSGDDVSDPEIGDER